MTANRTKTTLYYVQGEYEGKWVKTSVKYSDLEDAEWSLAKAINRYPGAKLRVVKEIVVVTTEIKVIDT